MRKLWDKLRGKDALPVIKKLRRRLMVVFLSLTGIILAGVLVVASTFSISALEENLDATFSNDALNAAYELVYNANVESIKVNLEALEQRTDSVVFASVDGEAVEIDPQTGTQTDREVLFEYAQEQAYDTGLIVSTGDTLMGAITVAEAEAAENGDIEVTEGAVDFMFGYEDTATAVAEEDVVEDEGAPDMDRNVFTTENGTEVELMDNYVAAASGQSETADDTIVEYIVSIGLGNEMTVTGDAGEGYRALYMDVFVEDVDPAGGQVDDDIHTMSYYELTVLQPHSVTRGERVGVYLMYVGLFFAGVLLLALVSWLLARLVTKPTAKSLQQQAEFVAAASHELKSPLTVMRTSLSAARVAPKKDEKEKYTGNAEREAERMSHLVEDLLLLAGGDAGSWKLQSETVDMDTLLIELGEQFKPVAKAVGATLLLRLPDEALGEVKGDADRLRQIVSVLVDNALQYAPEGTGVVLSAKKHKDKIVVDVIDHGEGIPDEEKDRVFERFYRADGSRTDKNHFGLGLSVAKELAELHEGTLTLKDTEGGGATFRLSLPQG